MSVFIFRAANPQSHLHGEYSCSCNGSSWLQQIWLGKLRKGISRNAPDNDNHFRPTYKSPSQSPTSIVEIWRGHDGLSLRQRNPPSSPPWPQEVDSTGEGDRRGGSCFWLCYTGNDSTTLSIFEFPHLFMREKGLTSWLFVLCPSKIFYLFF